MVELPGLATLYRRPALSGKVPRAVGIFSSILAPTTKHSFLKTPSFSKEGVTNQNGGDAGARTRDLGLKRALLYQLSYISKSTGSGVSYKKNKVCRIYFHFPLTSPLQ